jgi:hypothetical protein
VHHFIETTHFDRICLDRIKTCRFKLNFKIVKILDTIFSSLKAICKLKDIFLYIVMKVALFYTQNRSESSTFLHHFIPSPWR